RTREEVVPGCQLPRVLSTTLERGRGKMKRSLMVRLSLGWGLVVALAGGAAAQAKGVIKMVTSWPMQGAMIPEGTAMKQAVDLAVRHYGGEVAGSRIEVLNMA